MAFVSRRKAVELLKQDPKLRNLVEKNSARMNNLSSNNPKIIHDAIVKLSEPKNKRLVPTFISFFYDPHPAVRCTALLGVSCIGSPKNFKDMSKLMYDKDPGVRRFAIGVFGSLSREYPDALHYLLERAQKGMDFDTVKSMKRALAVSGKFGDQYELYAGLDRDKKFTDKKRIFVKKRQIKDGSRSILFGGRFFGKIRAVRIRAEAFNAWKKAFDAGIAVEPIMLKDEKIGGKPTGEKKPRIIRHKDGSVTVFARIIKGVSAAVFIRDPKNHKYFDDLRSQVADIKYKMGELGITHGHYHSANFVVRMVKGRPKVYLIDFDEASFTQKQ